MSLSLKQVENICLYGHGAKECRFLAEDDSNGKFYCLKHVVSRRARIDEEVDTFVKQCKARGIDAHQMSTPLGDNCKGYLYLKHKKQGYDVP